MTRRDLIVMLATLFSAAKDARDWVLTSPAVSPAPSAQVARPIGVLVLQWDVIPVTEFVDVRLGDPTPATV